MKPSRGSSSANGVLTELVVSDVGWPRIKVVIAGEIAPAVAMIVTEDLSLREDSTCTVGILWVKATNWLLTDVDFSAHSVDRVQYAVSDGPSRFVDEESLAMDVANIVP